jgi:hypothetical protein
MSAPDTATVADLVAAFIDPGRDPAWKDRFDWAQPADLHLAFDLMRADLAGLHRLRAVPPGELREAAGWWCADTYEVLARRDGNGETP